MGPLITALSLFFTRLSHPLAIGLALLSQTILICLITGLSSSSFWFSYILFLIFLGGILVLFIYVTSLASNEMFTPSITIAFVFTRVLLLSRGLLFIDPMIIPKTPLYDFGVSLKGFAYSSDLSPHRYKLNHFYSILFASYPYRCCKNHRRFLWP